MQLGRYQVSTLRPPPILSIDFSINGRFFAVATESGYEVWRSYPLALVRRKDLAGTLARVLILTDSPLLALQGGGKSPLYPPNKVVMYHDSLNIAVAELEFGDDIKGKGKAKFASNVSGDGFWMRKVGDWETTENELGLMAVATAPGSMLLAIPGRQPGHVQLVSLQPCRSPSEVSSPTSSTNHVPQTFRSPIILAHTHNLSHLECTASGSHLITTSARGTLVRIWNTARGGLERELRRGVDRAEMWGARFEDGDHTVIGSNTALEGSKADDADERRRAELRRKGGRIVGWSDKGTVHIWGDPEDDHRLDSSKGSGGTSQAAAITQLLSRNLPLPKYFSSAPSTALYHLPRKNPHAFASTMSAAAEAARMPSMKMREAGEEGDDWNERFVVGWVTVEVPDHQPDSTSTLERPNSARQEAFRPKSTEYRGGPSMGMREERRYAGSDTTSRTATPTAGRADTPPLSRRISSTTVSTAAHSSVDPFSQGHRRIGGSNNSRGVEKGRKAKVVDPEIKVEKRVKLERQLVAITYGGDWYRLKIPEPAAGDEGEAKSGRKCELVEYRRLNVGGGGW